MSHGVSLLLFGKPTLRCGSTGDAVAFPQKAFVLAAILHLSPNRRLSRAKLATMMYEEASQSGALANLRKLLSRVQERQVALGVDLIAIHRGDVQWIGDLAQVRCDLTVFGALRELRDGPDIGRLLELYQGDLLEEAEGCGDTLTAWIQVQRGRLRERFCALMQAGARQVGGLAAGEGLRRLLEVDPYRESAWRDLIGLQAAERGVAEAETVYEEMRRRFAIDLQTPVSPETARFFSSFKPVSGGAPKAPAHGRPAEARGQERARPTNALAVVPKLCILMPRCADADPSDAALSRALIEDVTLHLCRLKTIAVIAPHTTRQLAPELPVTDSFDVQYMAETSVRRFSGRTRLSVKLIRRSDRVILWGGAYDLVTAALCDSHHQLSHSITLALTDGIERAELARFDPERRPDAYQLYLRGRQHLRALRLQDVRRARRLFAEAADLAPGFAPALNGIARSLILEWLLLARTDRHILRQAHSVASRAVELDPFSGEARRELASATLFLDGLDGLDGAVEAFEHAEKLAPHHADILADYANALTHSSEVPLALKRIQKAIEFNPLPPDDYLWTAGGALFLMEDYEGALSQLARMKQQEPANRLMAACFAKTGQRKKASIYVERALNDQPNFRIGDWIATIPLRSKDHVEHYAGALSEAGFS